MRTSYRFVHLSEHQTNKNSKPSSHSVHFVARKINMNSVYDSYVRFSVIRDSTLAIRLVSTKFEMLERAWIPSFQPFTGETSHSTMCISGYRYSVLSVGHTWLERPVFVVQGEQTVCNWLCANISAKPNQICIEIWSIAKLKH